MAVKIKLIPCRTGLVGVPAAEGISVLFGVQYLGEILYLIHFAIGVIQGLTCGDKCCHAVVQASDGNGIALRLDGNILRLIAILIKNGPVIWLNPAFRVSRSADPLDLTAFGNGDDQFFVNVNASFGIDCVAVRSGDGHFSALQPGAVRTHLHFIAADGHITAGEADLFSVIVIKHVSIYISSDSIAIKAGITAAGDIDAARFDTHIACVQIDTVTVRVGSIILFRGSDLGCCGGQNDLGTGFIHIETAIVHIDSIAAGFQYTDGLTSSCLQVAVANGEIDIIILASISINTAAVSIHSSNRSAGGEQAAVEVQIQSVFEVDAITVCCTVAVHGRTATGGNHIHFYDADLTGCKNADTVRNAVGGGNCAAGGGQGAAAGNVQLA